jgi:hypothetical protein
MRAQRLPMHACTLEIRMKITTWLAVAAIAALTGCASPTPADYASERPTLELQKFFDGPMVAHGVLTGRSGVVKRRFVVEMVGRWNGDEGTLDERYTWSDGEKQSRTWRLKKLPGNRFTGTAEDAVGQADGEVSGNTANWHYTLKVPVNGKTHEFQFDDWMYLIDERTVINKVKMKKFGVEVGELSLSIRKP